MLNQSKLNNLIISKTSSSLSSSLTSSSTPQPINIKIPQSMTVFNLKDISSKFKKFKSINNDNNNNNTNSNIRSIILNNNNSVTASSILNVINQENKNTNDTTTTSTNTTSLKQSVPPPVLVIKQELSTNNTVKLNQEIKQNLPYYYSEYEKLYVCNLCNFTYDSLRSIKAHIWKHSGHHELSYPINDTNNKPNNNSNNNNGICSVLLEVIEKLRDEETSESTKTIHQNRSLKNNLKKKKLITDTNKIIKKAKLKLIKHKLSNKKRMLNIKTFLKGAKECKIETSVIDIYDENATILNNKEDIVYETDDCYFMNLSSSSSSSSSSSISNESTIPNNNTKNENNLLNSDFYNLLKSLTNNDNHDEQYVCHLCSYICYHLPSLKSHMWSHVKNTQFDYSINTTIINAALDYENKLNRKLNSIKKITLDNNNELLDLSTNSLNKNIYLQRQLNSALELVNYPQSATDNLVDSKINNNKNNKSSMVSFRCAKCGFQSINLSILRLHKREHAK